MIDVWPRMTLPSPARHDLNDVGLRLRGLVLKDDSLVGVDHHADFVELRFVRADLGEPVVDPLVCHHKINRSFRARCPDDWSIAEPDNLRLWSYIDTQAVS